MRRSGGGGLAVLLAAVLVTGAFAAGYTSGAGPTLVRVDDSRHIGAR
ncbi:hypothetical protein OG533_31635 [Streptomyces sp. NBC_01186]|nr:hypothetical protein OG533_31635 [Streptomyces sp. NBC_01186]